MFKEASPRIVILDGDAGMLELYRELMDDDGSAIVMHADVARLDAAGVRRLLDAADAEAVVWDIAPPYSAGCQVLRALIDSGDLDGCTVVVTTTDKPQVDDLLGKGAATVLSKPFDIEEMSALLRHGRPKTSASP